MKAEAFAAIDEATWRAFALIGFGLLAPRWRRS